MKPVCWQRSKEPTLLLQQPLVNVHPCYVPNVVHALQKLKKPAVITPSVQD